PIHEAESLLRKLVLEQSSQGHETRVLIATDGPAFNINTLSLARQAGSGLQSINLDTLVYDALNKRSMEDGLRRIEAADFVLFLKPGLPAGPQWSTVWAEQYRAHCQALGLLLDSHLSAEFDVFDTGNAHQTTGPAQKVLRTAGSR